MSSRIKNQLIQNQERLNMIETPHLAITHLLKAIETNLPSQQPTNKSILQALRRQKHESQIELEIMNNRIANSPCAIRLEQQVLQLQHLVQGLKHQNIFRKEQGWMQIQKVNNAYSTQSTDFLQQQSNKVGEEMAFHKSQQRRLQEQYQLLILRIRKLHEWNEGIVNSYGKHKWEQI